MNRRVTSRIAIALLAVVLSFSTDSAFAAARHDRDFIPSVRDRIVQILKKVVRTFGMATNDDVPTSPRPPLP